MASSLQNLCITDLLKVSGSNIADNWNRFKEQYRNYEIASHLSEASQQKYAAVFLTCIGNDAYDIRAMEFASGDDRRKLYPTVAVFEQFCIGTVNVTYE